MGVSVTNHRYPCDLSVVLPVYNEEDNIQPVHDELIAVLDILDLRYEIIYVDDGSRDSSRAKITQLAETSPETVRAVLLRRNFGQTAAIQAGIDHANGAIIALMDADLQNDPHDIPKMLEQMEREGYDLISGWREKRQDRAITRKLPSRIANRIISLATGVYLHDYGCTLKTYRREVLDHVRLYGEMHRFIPVLANAAGARIVERSVNHRARIYGKSKYGLWRAIKVVLDLMTVTFMTKYNTRPMYIFGGFAALHWTLSMLSLLIMVISGIVTGDWYLNSPLPIAAIVFAIAAVQFVLMGLNIEMLMRTYYESQGKGPYAIQRVINGYKHIPLPVSEPAVSHHGNTPPAGSTDGSSHAT